MKPKNESKPNKKSFNLTLQILFAMLLGMLTGFAIRFLLPDQVAVLISEDILKTGGDIFITVLRMLVVPVVFVSLVCGSSALNVKKLGRIGVKTLFLYLFTTAVAITLAIFISSLFAIGKSTEILKPVVYTATAAPSLREVIVNLFPGNPFKAFAEGNMLQIIMFSILFGIAISMSGKPGESVANFFADMNAVVMKLITIVIKFSPYGIFCLIATLFAKIGFNLILQLLGYFSVVLLVLFIHTFVSYPVLLRLLGGLNPITFFRKFYSVLLFAFSTSSSTATIPYTLETLTEKMGVKNSIASFTVPLGATINMDGTAIMQGVATVFIANVYQIPLDLAGYLTIILMATLASIGTAGVPSVGLITLAMVLNQLHIPAEGIALIIGVDRLLDMARTATNVCGDAVVTCVVAKSEKGMSVRAYIK